MKTYVTWGGILTAATAVLMLVLYLGGFQTTKIGSGQALQWLGFPIMIAILYLGAKAARDARPGRSMTYGQALGAVVMISLFGGLFNGVYTAIHFGFINTEFPDYMIDYLRTKLETQGKMSDEQIENMLSFQRMMFKPAVQAVFAFLGQLIVGTIVGLILAIFIKRAPAAEPPLPPVQAAT